MSEFTTLMARDGHEFKHERTGPANSAHVSLSRIRRETGDDDKQQMVERMKEWRSIDNRVKTWRHQHHRYERPEQSGPNPSRRFEVSATRTIQRQTRDGSEHHEDRMVEMMRRNRYVPLARYDRHERQDDRYERRRTADDVSNGILHGFVSVRGLLANRIASTQQMIKPMTKMTAPIDAHAAMSGPGAGSAA